MTALLAPRPERQAPPPPGLRPVAPPRRQVRTAGFVAVVAAILGIGMVGVLILTTVLQDAAFKVEEKQAQATALANQLSDLQARVADARSVQHLGVAAQQLGMKPNPYPVQLRLPDGKVVGSESKVSGGEIPSVRYLTDEAAARELLARHEAEAKAAADAAAKKQAAAQQKAAAAKAKAEAKAKAKAEAAAAAAAAAAKAPTAKAPTAKAPAVQAGAAR